MLAYYLSTWVSVCYPIYASLGVYSRKEQTSEINFWLKYWTIRSLLLIIEWGTLEWLELLPYFYETRTVIYFLLIFRAEWVYNKLLEPLLLTSENTVDFVVDKASEQASSSFKNLGTGVVNFASERVKELIDHSTADPEQERAQTDRSHATPPLETEDSVDLERDPNASALD